MGNKATRLLAFHLRKAQSNHVVPKMKHSDTNTITSQPKEVAEAFAAYYKRNYMKVKTLIEKEVKITKLLDSIQLNRLSQDEAEMLSSPITVQEIIDSISKLKSSKSPGVDGYSGYYKAFVSELAPILCRVCNYALDRGNYYSYTKRWEGPHLMYGLLADKVCFARI